MFTASRIESESREINPRSGKRVDPDARPHRPARAVCSECLQRPAVTCLRGRRVVLKDHDVCRQCWRKWMDARAARRSRGQGR